MKDVWMRMRTEYEKMRLNEDEINKRMLCKCNIILERENKSIRGQLGKCDKKQ